VLFIIIPPAHIECRSRRASEIRALAASDWESKNKDPANNFFEEIMMKVFEFFVALLMLTVGAAYQVSAQETKVKWFGHAAFSITTPKGKVLLIDPWLTNPLNPEAKDGKDPLASVPKVDYILLTHGHRDHVGDAVAIAKRTGAVLISNPELAGNLVKLADFPNKQAETDAIMGIGGEIQIADGEVTVAMTPAVHSSSVFNPKAGATEAERAYGGNPAGFVLIIKNGPTVYHSGDTAYFKDMETIGEQYQVDVALLNIGGHFGMEPRMAAKAAQSVRAKLAIPQHYATFPGITANSHDFASELTRLKIPFYEMKPGETIMFHGKQLIKKETANNSFNRSAD
jgi:L-ascorbate metabolism protein UlaG (beta-lactamase superfamily)